MKNLAPSATCKLHDCRSQRSLRGDEDGLTLLAAAVFAFGQDAGNEAGTRVDGAPENA